MVRPPVKRTFGEIHERGAALFLGTLVPSATARVTTATYLVNGRKKQTGDFFEEILDERLPSAENSPSS
jgi:hypothetical protein